MLEMLGSGYVIDHVVAEHNIRVNEENYKNYTSDILMAIASSLGISVTERFADINKPTVNEELSGDEIALQVIKRAGLKGRT